VREKERGSVKETMVEETVSILLGNIDVMKLLDQQQTSETQDYQAALPITIQSIPI
jgi:hypothetical protein